MPHIPVAITENQRRYNHWYSSAAVNFIPNLSFFKFQYMHKKKIHKFHDQREHKKVKNNYGPESPDIHCKSHKNSACKRQIIRTLLSLVFNLKKAADRLKKK